MTSTQPFGRTFTLRDIVLTFFCLSALLLLFHLPTTLDRYARELAIEIAMKHIDHPLYGSHREDNLDFHHNPDEANIIPLRSSGCPQPYGKTVIFVAVKFRPGSSTLKYSVAQTTLKCYAARQGYELLVVNLMDDKLTGSACDMFSMGTFHFRRHCHLAMYMTHRPDVKWWLALDADVMVVNPHRCIHEYIDKDIHLTYYERFWNLEVMTGGHLLKNSHLSREFLRRLAAYERKTPANPKLAWHGHDNGSIHLLLLEMLFPNNTLEIDECRNTWNASESLDKYWRYVWCCRSLLGRRRVYAPTFRLLHRGEGWAMDLYVTGWRFSDGHFMSHGVKTEKLAGQEVFQVLPSGNHCTAEGSDWPYKPGKRITMVEMKPLMKSADDSIRKGLNKSDTLGITTNFLYDIGRCWPQCPMSTQ